MIFRHILIFICASVLMGCASPHVNSADIASGESWVLVYANDKEGNTVEGAKETLIASVRAGKPVRIYTAGRRIEHAADAQFLTIFDDEVFAQITPINSQKPEENPPRILFRQADQQWRSIVGTNGHVTALMDGNEPNVRTGATKWFVQN